jgi:hypothetical protein
MYIAMKVEVEVINTDFVVGENGRIGYQQHPFSTGERTTLDRYPGAAKVMHLACEKACYTADIVEACRS